MDTLELIYNYYYHNGSTNMIAKQLFDMVAVVVVTVILGIAIHLRIDVETNRLFFTNILSGWVTLFTPVVVFIIYQLLYCIYLHRMYKPVKELFNETLGINGNTTFSKYVESVCNYYSITEEHFRKVVTATQNKYTHLIKSDVIVMYDGWVFKYLFSKCMDDSFNSDNRAYTLRRCRIYGIISLLLSPFIFIGGLLVKYPSEIAANIYTEGAAFYVGRYWTTNYMIQKRRSIELPHEYEERMKKASILMAKYIKSSRWGRVVKLEIIVRTLMMIIVTILAPLFTITLINDKVMIVNHSVFYICTILTMCLTMLGKLLPADVGDDSSLIFNKLCTELDITVDESHSLYKDLLSNYPYKGWLLLVDMTSPLWAPLYFIFVMPHIIENGVAFLSSSVYEQMIDK